MKLKKIFFILSFFFLIPLFVSAQMTVTDQIIPSNLFSGQPISKLLNQLFYIGLVFAVMLALIMIIRGGVEYMTIDAITSKERGKQRIKAALGGLLLAFSAILILNTISPGLTSLRIEFVTPERISSVQIETDIQVAISQYTGMSEQQYQEFLATGKIPTNISPTAQKILAEAYNMVGFETGTIPGTEAGKRACAAAVNKLFEAATGQQIGGGFSTEQMNEVLKQDSRFQYVAGGTSAAQPGDIIISPTNGSNVGHVGIVANNGAVISNHSKRDNRPGDKSEVRQNFTLSSWNNYYGNRKNLPVYIYRPL